MSDVLIRLEDQLVDAAKRQVKPRRRLRPLAVAATALALTGCAVAVATQVVPGVREDRGPGYLVKITGTPGVHQCLVVVSSSRGGVCARRLESPLYGFAPVGRDLVVYGVVPASTVQAEVSGRSGAHALAKPYTQPGVDGKLFAVRLRGESFPHPCVVLRDAHGRELARIDECHRPFG